LVIVPGLPAVFVTCGVEPSMVASWAALEI